MGYIRHHAIIITSWKEEVSQAHEEAVKIFGDLVSNIVYSKVNLYASFFIAPDGSKEGWEESHEGDQKRDNYLEWVKAQTWSDGSSWLDYVELFYGDDEGEAEILNHN